MKERKRSVLIIDWEQKGGSRSLSIDSQGDKLPDEIRVMLVGSLLRDLRGKIELDVRTA